MTDDSKVHSLPSTVFSPKVRLSFPPTLWLTDD